MYAFALRRAAINLYTTVRHYDNHFRLVKEIRMDEDIDDKACEQAILNSHLLRDSFPTENNRPLLLCINDEIIYAWIPLSENGFLLGPTHFANPVQLRYHIPVPELDTASLLTLIPECTLQILSESTLILYNLERTGETAEPFLEQYDLLTENCIIPGTPDNTLSSLYNLIFENVENSFAHNPYNHEKRECNCIRTGDTEGLAEIIKERFPGRYGKLSKNPLTQEIYMGIVGVTLATRAAIDGGLHPETAFYLSDVAIQRLDACKNPETCILITQETEMHCAKLVQELRQKKEGDVPSDENRHISHCKDYIFSHLHGKITVQEIADAIGLEANYLSALFRKCEGITLKQFILQEKITLAKNLLTYSDYSYIQIATYLGFASQSHMGQEFKKVTGLTPRAYREQNASEDFMNDTLQ